MIAISNDFKTAMKQPVKELQAYITGVNQDIRSDNDLIQFKISAEGGLCKTVMRKLEAKFTGNHNLLGQWVNVGFGVKLAGGGYEYIDYGSFLVTEITNVKDTGVTTITGYDRMIRSMTKYNPMAITGYPMGLYDYTVQLCASFGMGVYNNSFDVHNDWQITQDLWENIDGITYRDILQQIAQVTCTTVIITNDDKIYFKPITNTNETLTYDNMMKLKLEPIYGEINSVILSRTPQEDNIYMRDEDSIDINGLTEWKIENNEIIDKDRDSAMTLIYDAMHGISYYPFETTTEGLGWYEVGDNFDIVNDIGDVFNTTLFNYSITIDGSIKEVLKTVAQTKTQTQYQYANPINRRIKNTEIIVNKQEEYIQQLVSDMYNEDGIVNENFAKLLMELSNIIMSVQQSGGNNLIKNSVGFAGTTEWDLTYDNEETSTVNTQASVELLENGTSGGAFILSGVKISQSVIVSPNADYCFSCKVNKRLLGTGFVKLYNPSDENQVWLREFEENESLSYEEIKFEGINISGNTLIVEIYGDEASNLVVTDSMLNKGNLLSVWTQANGEILNTLVNINMNGVMVKSLQFDETGQYVTINPLEFAGYAKKNGVQTRVFTLNGDTTVVNKLRAEEEISMKPIKIVPINGTSNDGWGFVSNLGGGD